MDTDKNEERPLQKCQTVVGQASSLSSLLGKPYQHDRQDACPTTFAEFTKNEKLRMKK
jgi:hypothetical protein